jgi:transposase-like protein
MDKGFLEECLAQGMALEAIGELAGKHPSTVSYWLHKYGLQANGVRHTPKGGVSRAELEPLVDEGLTVEGIARRLGIGDTTARKWLKRHGLQTENGRRRATLAATRRNGKKETQLNCRRHGLTTHIRVASESRLRCTRCRSEAVSRETPEGQGDPGLRGWWPMFAMWLQAPRRGASVSSC